MRTRLIAGVAVTALAAAAQAEPVKVGVLMGFTGPVETLTPDMGAAAEMALAEISAAGTFMGGRGIETVRGDSTCVDAQAAVAAAERLLTGERVDAILGAACSGATSAVALNVAVPNGVAIISPSATSPGLSEIDDRGLFFRTAPSDARQGEVLAEIARDHGIEAIAVTYTGNDYGKGLADAFRTAFEALGSSVAVEIAHVDGKADYSAEIGVLSASGAEHLLVIGYADQGGRQIVQAALDAGAFDSFLLPDGMIGQAMLDAIGPDLDGAIGAMPGGDDDRSRAFEARLEASGITGNGPYRGESYDAAAVLALAMHKAASTDGAAVAAAMQTVVNAPGEPIAAGELDRALAILSDGGDIDYVGATDVEFSDVGEASGSFREMLVRDGTFEIVRAR